MNIKSFGIGLLASLSVLVACQNQVVSQSTGETTAQREAASSSASLELKTETSSDRKAANETLYASVLDRFRPVVVKQTMPDLAGQDDEAAFALNRVYDAVSNRQTITYSFVDINQDKQDELLIGSADSLYAIYYLDANQKPVIIKGAGVAGRGGERALLQIYVDGTVLYSHFRAMSPEVESTTYLFKRDQFKAIQSIDYTVDESESAMARFGLDEVALMDLTQLDWQSFETKQATAPSSTDSAKGQMDLNAIQSGDFTSIQGSWQDGYGHTLTFDQNGLVSDQEEVQLQYARLSKGALHAGVTPKNPGPGGAGLSFVPAGVALTAEATSSTDAGFSDPSDPTKDRLWMGHQLTGSDKRAFYYKVN